MKRELTTALVILLGLHPGSATPGSVEHVLGAGEGIPYGGLGLNYEVGLHQNVVPTAGLGYFESAFGWNLGARLYASGQNAKVRLRGTVLFGTNTVVHRAGADSDVETGLSGGIGLNWRISRKWAFDADVFLPRGSVPEGYKRETDYVIELGVSYRWSGLN